MTRFFRPAARAAAGEARLVLMQFASESLGVANLRRRWRFTRGRRRRGRNGMILWVRGKDYARAARALGAR